MTMPSTRMTTLPTEARGRSRPAAADHRLRGSRAGPALPARSSVVVIAERVEADGLEVVWADAAYVGAQLVVIIVETSAQAAGLPAEVTVLEAPPSDPDGIFGRTVGRFAAALDQGRRRERRRWPWRPRAPAGWRRPNDQAGSISSGPSLRTLLTSGRTG